jgi:histidine ammonia-lyase
MPATAFSRSTECHNQDKVSMGTIAARDALRVLDLSERVLAIVLLAACQALELRGAGECRPRSGEVLRAVRTSVAFNDGDRRQDIDIASVVDRLRHGDLALGAPEEP